MVAPLRSFVSFVVKAPAFPITCDVGDPEDDGDPPLPPPPVIPEWRRLEGVHPRPSQIGVDFSNCSPFGVGFSCWATRSLVCQRSPNSPPGRARYLPNQPLLHIVSCFVRFCQENSCAKFPSVDFSALHSYGSTRLVSMSGSGKHSRQSKRCMGLSRYTHARSHGVQEPGSGRYHR